jgi:predicted anti-sigma-YlaC factor YlaD
MMTCDTFQSALPDMLLDPSHVPAQVQQHVLNCAPCRAEWNELQQTLHLLDEWTAPEPSPYFDTRIAARIREEKNAPAPGWLERLRTRLMLGGRVNLRPAMAAAFALLLVSGVGSYEGFVSLNRTQTHPMSVSATVADLELLDTNAQTLQQLSAFDDQDYTVGQSAGASASQ